jgi:hypothetical protein
MAIAGKLALGGAGFYQLYASYFRGDAILTMPQEAWN